MLGHLNYFLLTALILLSHQTQAVEVIKKAPLFVAERITLKSQTYKQDRDIYVSLPDEYATESKAYPVLYVLDGDFFIKMADTVTKNLSVSHQAEDMIVVAITQKNRHLELKQPGAAQLQTFIDTEVINFINDNYRTNDFKALYGHSLGASFALYSMVNKPKLFNAYLAVSPVIEIQGTPEMATLKTFFAENMGLPKYLFISKANEDGNYAKTIPQLTEYIEQNTDDSFRWKYQVYADKTHGTVPLTAMDESLADLYQGRIMPELGELNEFNSMEDIKNIGGYQAVKNYYAQYSKKMGTDFPVPSIVYSRFAWIYFNHNQHELLTDLVKQEGKDNEVVNYYLGSSYLSKKDFKRAINLLNSDLKHNPFHSRGWYTLGLAYRDSGNHAKALKAISQSIELSQDKSLKAAYTTSYNQLINSQ